MNFIVGLTGGIGSGKTTVANLFATLGVAVVDTDAIAHELTGVQGTALHEIVAAFGKNILLVDGSLDRAAIRRLVFTDATAKSRLENILHPMIRRESEARCRATASATNTPYVLLVVPLLIESGWYAKRVDRILVVDCDEEVQISRVMARSHLSRDEVRAILATQSSRAERLAVADDVISNDNTNRESLVEQIAVLHRRYLEFAGLGRKADILNADC